MRVDDAVAPRATDNAKAADVRSHYDSAWREAREEQQRAALQARNLGDGHRYLGDGSTVSISTLPGTGRRKLVTVHPDGTHKSVSVDPKDASFLALDARYPNGATAHLELEGDRVSRSTTPAGMLGFPLPTVREDFHLNSLGEPVAELFLNGQKQTHTVALADGSTDQDRYAYTDPDGHRVFEFLRDGPRPLHLDPPQYFPPPAV